MFIKYKRKCYNTRNQKNLPTEQGLNIDENKNQLHNLPIKSRDESFDPSLSMIK